jgi:hypothetical protein
MGAGELTGGVFEWLHSTRNGCGCSLQQGRGLWARVRWAQRCCTWGNSPPGISSSDMGAELYAQVVWAVMWHVEAAVDGLWSGAGVGCAREGSGQVS